MTDGLARMIRHRNADAIIDEAAFTGAFRILPSSLLFTLIGACSVSFDGLRK